MDDDGRNQSKGVRIGPSAEQLGRSPRMIRYLEEHGVLRPERGPGPRGHRHFPPPELALGAAAARALDLGYSSGVLRALRELADRGVASALAEDDPLAWFEMLAIARAVEAVVRNQLPPPLPPHRGPERNAGPRPAGTRGPHRHDPPHLAADQPGKPPIGPDEKPVGDGDEAGDEAPEAWS